MIELLHLCRRASALALLLAALSPQQAFCVQGGPTGLLNDSGQTQCNNGTAMVACDAATTGDASPRPRQDGRFGRDVAGPAKVGGGAAGFDFTKVCMNGTLNCATAANTGAAPASTDWACTQDNTTNLIWSLYSGSGDWTTARTTLPNAANLQSRCGAGNPWRLPTRRELFSIVNRDGRSPSIDSNYFPATQADWYWTNDPNQPVPAFAWDVSFVNGNAGVGGKSNSYYVRLVRSGQ
jgi:hypothetical protein